MGEGLVHMDFFHCALDEPEGAVFSIEVERKVHTVLFPSTYHSFLSQSVSLSVPFPSDFFFLPIFHFHQKQILHRKRCCFKQSVMSAFL